MGSLLWTQVKTLLWRNYLLKRRNLGEAIQEVLFPIYWVVILVIIASFNANGALPPVPNFNVYDLDAYATNSVGELAFAPSGSAQAAAIMASVHAQFPGTTLKVRLRPPAFFPLIADAAA